MANDDHGGHLTAGFMGAWGSDAKDGYIFALRRRVERAAWSIGRPRVTTGPLAVRPGPVSHYAK